MYVLSPKLSMEYHRTTCSLTDGIVFLAQLLIIIGFLLSEVLLQTNLLSVPYVWVLRSILPDIYGPDVKVQVPRYFSLGLLCVAVTTLALFFLSGMYSEKIAYANK